VSELTLATEHGEMPTYVAAPDEEACVGAAVCLVAQVVAHAGEVVDDHDPRKRRKPRGSDAEE